VGHVDPGMFDKGRGNAVRNHMRTRRQTGNGTGLGMGSGRQDVLGGAKRVLFDVHLGGAREVHLAGTFNDWQPSTLPMVNTGPGRWEKELLLAPGRYEYRVIADGRWVEDPACDEKTPNPFGGLNSVRHVD